MEWWQTCTYIKSSVTADNWAYVATAFLVKMAHKITSWSLAHFMCNTLHTHASSIHVKRTHHLQPASKTLLLLFVRQGKELAGWLPAPEHTLLLVGPAAMTAMYTRWSLPIHTIISLVRAKHILQWGIKAKKQPHHIQCATITQDVLKITK